MKKVSLFLLMLTASLVAFGQTTDESNGAAYMFPIGIVLILVVFYFINRVRTNNKIAKIKTEQDRLSNTFWDCRKAVNKLLDSLIGIEFAEVSVIKNNLTNLGLTGDAEWGKTSVTPEMMREYIDNYKSFNSNTNNTSLLKNLEHKCQLAASATKYASKWDDNRFATAVQGVTELCSKLEHLTFDKTDYSSVRGAFTAIIDSIKLSVDNLKLAINTHNADSIEKFVNEIAASEQQHTALSNKYGIVLSNDNNKINKAKNAKSDIRQKISAMEAHCNRRGVSSEAAARTRQQCSTMYSQLDTYSDFDLVQLYLMYDIMFAQVDNTCMDAQAESQAYEQQVYEDNQREEAAAQQQRDDDAQQQRDDDQAAADQQAQDDRDNNDNNNSNDNDSYSSSDSSSCGSDD